MLYAYAIRYASRCSASLTIVSYNIPYTCTHIVSYRITYYPAHTHAIGSMHMYAIVKHNSWNRFATPYEKPKRFTIFLFQVGGWVKSDSFSF